MSATEHSPDETPDTTPDSTPGSTPESEAGDESRPDLRIVRDTDTPTDTPAPAETDTERTGEIPVLDSDGTPVAPKAPLDVRVREQLVAFARTVPGLTTAPPSLSESLEHSQHGDWTTSESSAKRAAHGLATVVAYLVTFPADLVVHLRCKPLGFLALLAVVFCLYKLAF